MAISTRARATLAFLIAVFSFAQLASAYTPEHPQVQAMIKRGTAFMTKNFETKNRYKDELGAICMCALACYKATGNAQHPLVGKAVAKIRKDLQGGMKHSGHANYSLGIAMIFLGELDPDAYRQEIQAMLDEVYKRQTEYGAFTYPNDPLGDVSQTQYAVLGMWLAHRQGINVDQQAVERVCNWLLRVQTPQGAFPYKGKDPGSFNRIAQERTTASMGCAGVGSLYVTGELLGFIDDPKKMKLRTRLPPAFRPVRGESDGPIAKLVDHGVWQKGVNDGNNWIGRNGRVENDGAQQQYYYMYAVERYWAFRELAEGIDTKEPAWYNGGVEYCKRNQKPDGSWVNENGAIVDTAFATMFLLRTSKATVTRLVIEAGRLTGGKGLSADMSTAKVTKSGKVVTADATKATSELLKMLDDPKAPKGEFVSEIPDKIVLSRDPKKRAGELARLRRLLINGSFQARLTAAKTLGTIRDLDNGPYLIFALSDPDHRIVRAARDSLRFVSRKRDGFGMEIGSERPEKPVWTKAQNDWKNWLLAVKPDSELIE